MNVRVQLIDICLPDYMRADADIAVPVSSQMTYVDLVEAICDEWHTGAGPDADVEDVEDAVVRCVKTLKDFSTTPRQAWGDPVYDFQPFDDSEVCAYFDITLED